VSRGQSLVELAVCAPVVIVLALGTVATVEIVDARAGLEAATQAAAADAASASDPVSGERNAQARFAAVIAAYPVRSAFLRVTFGGFDRAAEVAATSSGQVDLSWSVLDLPGALKLESRVAIPLEPWRSHSPLS
jgi:Flp pilus assembly protein TadG